MAGFAAGMLGVALLTVGAPQPLQESARVERVVIDAFVVAPDGAPIRRLAAADFDVEVDGRPVPVESVEWIGAGSGAPAGAPAGPVPAAPRAPRAAQRFVLFFQMDLSELSRITGWMRLRRLVEALVARASPRDEFAVLSFDSHLKLLTDFTSDRDRVIAAIERTRMVAEPGETAGNAGAPGLSARFDFAAARRASLCEDALRITGDALAGLPGRKFLLFVGYGMGDWSPGFGVVLGHRYARALDALTRSGTSVVSIDETSADYHSLQAGLQAAAADTGGFYVRTFRFPALAIRKVERATSGYYEITLRRPDLPRREHRVSLSVRGRHPEIYYRPTYDDSLP